MITNRFDEWKVLYRLGLRQPDNVDRGRRGLVFAWKCSRGTVHCQASEKPHRQWSIHTPHSTTRIPEEIAVLHIAEPTTD